MTNPLLAAWTGPFEAPPFAAIEPAHFRPAFDAALAENVAEIEAIAENPAPATFDNTIAALERSGAMLDRVGAVFFNLSGADTNDALQEIERAMAPILSRHSSAIYLNANLFRRIDDLFRRRGTLGLDAEQARVLERYHTIFSRAGGGLPEATKDRLAAIGERLATLGTQFSQNLLADERGWELVLAGPDDLTGLPQALIDAAAATAQERGHPGKHVITLSRSSVEPFLQFSGRRDLRERAFQAWAKRGENGGATDNRAIAAEMIALRAERAKLLGYASFAALPTGRFHGEDAGERPHPAAVCVGARRRPAPRAKRSNCRRLLRRKASMPPSSRGTGATSPRSGARPLSISTRARSSHISSSTA